MPPAMSQANVRMPLGHGRHLPLDHDGCGELKSEQAGRVVDETLSFENVDDAARQPDAPGNGSCGNGVCRGHHRTEHEAQAPVKAGENSGRNQGNRGNGESDQAEGQKKDADKVVAKVAPGSGPGSGIEQRRENNQEDKIGIKGDIRDAGNKSEQQSANDHDDRVWRSESSGEEPENNDKKQQKKKDEFDFPDSTHWAQPIL